MTSFLSTGRVKERVFLEESAAGKQGKKAIEMKHSRWNTNTGRAVRERHTNRKVGIITEDLES